MVMTRFHNPFNLSSSGLSRTCFPVPVFRDSLVKISPSQRSVCNFGGKTACGQRKKVSQVKAAVADAPPAEGTTGEINRSLPTKKARILVAGGGIGGLVFALAAKKKGFEVVVFERDISAIRGEGQYRGPIQIQSNALAALEAIDLEVAEEVMRVGCITGDRINGLVDGVSGNWYEFLCFD